MNNPNKSLQLGLNSRGLRSKVAAFQDDSDESSSENQVSSQDRRQAVNKQLYKEQLSLQKRAVDHYSNQGGGLNDDIFDYDNHYESFSSNYQQSQMKPERPNTDISIEKKKESRYISSLLHHAKLRQQEREIVLERKIAKEQAEEESKEEYKGKDRFVTNAFKRKLQEREAWIKNDEEQRKREEKEDVTKKVGGENILLAGFVSLQKNLSMGPVDHRSVGTKTLDPTVPTTNSVLYEPPSSGTQSYTNPSGKEKQDFKMIPMTHDNPYQAPSHSTKDSSLDVIGTPRVSRLTKILAARRRYLDRIKEMSL